MRKLRVGIMVYRDSQATEGGAHSFYSTLLEGINNFRFDDRIEIINIVPQGKESIIPNLKKECIYLKDSLKLKVNSKIKQAGSTYLDIKVSRQNSLINSIASFITNLKNKRIENELKRNQIDLIYYMKQEWDILNYPFIATHWDTAHKSSFSFPEFALDGIHEKREKYYVFKISKAFAILCESETGAEELIHYYRLNSSKVKVLPIFPTNIINLVCHEEKEKTVLQKYNLKKNLFFFYPAQLWPHKNHYNLLVAFKDFVTQYPDVKLILCGSDKGNISYIQGLINEWNLSRHVILTGFVAQEELLAFYTNALALVMPTFLGPTNLPLLEAAFLKCCIICSDFAGHKEILQDNAIYIKPADSSAILASLIKVLDDDTRNKLKESAYVHIKQSVFNLDKSLKTLNDILLEILPIRKTWGSDFIT